MTSVIALFIALGGTAWALQANSVKSKHIVDGQVRTADVANDTGPHALTGSDIASESLDSTDIGNDALSGFNIQESTLGKVPDADTLDGKNSSDFVVPGSEGWQALGLYDNPQFCHWVNFGNGFNPAAMFRDPAGVVHFRGLIKAVDGSIDACGINPSADPLLLTGFLPQGYRPANRELFTISSNNKPARLDVLAEGPVQIAAPTYPTWADAEQWVSLDGINYRCAPSGQDGCP